MLASDTAFEAHRQAIREGFMALLNGGVDRLTSELILPADQAAQLQDMAQAAMFIFVIKITEARGQAPTRENLMTAFLPLWSDVRREVPDAIRQFAQAYAAANQLPAVSLNDPI